MQKEGSGGTSAAALGSMQAELQDAAPRKLEASCSCKAFDSHLPSRLFVVPIQKLMNYSQQGENALLVQLKLGVQTLPTDPGH
jgi:hypothetical protein